MNVTFCIFESTMYCNSTKSREWLSIVDFTSYLKLTFFIFQLIKAVSKNQTGLKHIRQLLFSVYSSAREKNEDKIFGMTRKCFMMMGSGTSSLKRFFISATTGYLAIVIRTCFRIKRPNIQRKQCYMQCHYMVMLIDEQSRQHFELHLNSKMNKKTKRVPMRSFAKLIHIVI